MFKLQVQQIIDYLEQFLVRYYLADEFFIPDNNCGRHGHPIAPGHGGLGIVFFHH
jgi:hypothetical protein